ncbi:hypothetical protein MNBD_GAMMA07-124 [hydrothermal vent metagenome]|uniref:Spermidine synthase n=1 Tax=hydrothermal vent metagenome TaxID=652676 RepID=A0A3B0X3B2_9ZZZZ
MLGGEVIHQTSDEYGNIEVVDYMQQIRALQFGNETQQSACLLCNPSFLVHNYAQAMTLPLCWIKPKRVLVLGLGAGSIVKYILNTFNDVEIDAIELRKEVYNVAIQYFNLPKKHERLNVFINSAQNWLNKTNNFQYDMIIVDVFLTSHTGKDTTINLQSCHTQLYNLLTRNGVLSINYLNDNNIKCYPGMTHLSSLFNQQIYTVNIENINSIILASKNKIPQVIENEKFSQVKKISSVSYQKYFHLMQAAPST